ncbi:hypothetical protein D9M72_182080 [compost metagenome]
MASDQNARQALRTLQYNEGRRLVRAYLTRLRSRNVTPEEELVRTVSSMQGYTLEIFCRFLEKALQNGFSAEAWARKLNEQIDPHQKRFEDVAVRFALAGCALLRKKKDDHQTVYQVMCLGRLIETLPNLDAAERFLQQSTIGGDHAGT